MASNDMTPGIPGGNPPVSPLPGAGALDEAIERHLAQFDAVPPEVRRTAWILAELVQRLTPAGVLQVLGFAHLVARDRG
jgi:hypothetical protein